MGHKIYVNGQMCECAARKLALKQPNLDNEQHYALSSTTHCEFARHLQSNAVTCKGHCPLQVQTCQEVIEQIAVLI